jgi:hypothetical protein
VARIPGRNSRLYVSITSGGTATPIAFVAKVEADMTVNQYDVTALGDVNLVTVPGLPSYKGTYAGFYDDATAQTFTAALDGVARNFYFYPDVGTTSRYQYGTAFFDAKLITDVNGSVSMSGNFSAAGPVNKSW